MQWAKQLFKVSTAVRSAGAGAICWATARTTTSAIATGVSGDATGTAAAARGAGADRGRDRGPGRGARSATSRDRGADRGAGRLVGAGADRGPDRGRGRGPGAGGGTRAMTDDAGVVVRGPRRAHRGVRARGRFHRRRPGTVDGTTAEIRGTPMRPHRRAPGCATPFSEGGAREATSAGSRTSSPTSPLRRPGHVPAVTGAVTHPPRRSIRRCIRFRRAASPPFDRSASSSA